MICPFIGFTGRFVPELLGESRGPGPACDRNRPCSNPSVGRRHPESTVLGELERDHLAVDTSESRASRGLCDIASVALLPSMRAAEGLNRAALTGPSGGNARTASSGSISVTTPGVRRRARSRALSQPFVFAFRSRDPDQPAGLDTGPAGPVLGHPFGEPAMVLSGRAGERGPAVVGVEERLGGRGSLLRRRWPCPRGGGRRARRRGPW